MQIINNFPLPVEDENRCGVRTAVLLRQVLLQVYAPVGWVQVCYIGCRNIRVLTRRRVQTTQTSTPDAVTERPETVEWQFRVGMLRETVFKMTENTCDTLASGEKLTKCFDLSTFL